MRAYEALAESVELFELAVAEAEGDPEILAVAHEGVAFCLWRSYERLDEVLEHSEEALRLALELGNEALAGESLRRARDLGDESSPPYTLAHLSLVECELGDLEVARGHALEGRASAEQAGQRAVIGFARALEALIEAQRGNGDQARAAAQDALRLASPNAGRQGELLANHALGHLALALDRPEAVVAQLEPFLAFVRREAIVEPSALRFVVDYVEALAALGRDEDASELLDWYEGNARRLGRTSAVAAALRCRGLLAAQAGNVDVAIASYEAALESHARADRPLDRGRTLLALGVALRRAKRRREARTRLEGALELFERIGAALWAERARGELKRISGRAATPGALTPAEERVAALVAEGKTNKEVAAALFLSDRTVEGHLARVFGKLRIRHRAEVAGALQTRVSTESNTGDSPVSAETVSP